MRSICYITLFILHGLCSCLFAEEIRLFDPAGTQVPNYDKIVENLSPGDELVFNDGEYRYLVEETLGTGGTTKVLRVRSLAPASESPQALRIPLKAGYYENRYAYPTFITSFVRGAPALEEKGIRIPRIYQSYTNQFVAVEVVKPAFTVGEFLKADDLASPEVMAEAEEALYRFAKQTSPFAKIGDFRAQQLVYDLSLKEWILLDYTRFHQKFFLFDLRTKKRHAFYDVFFWDDDKKVLSEREKNFYRKITEIVKERDKAERKACLMLFLPKPH